MLDESRNVRHGFFEPTDFEKVLSQLTPEAYADAAAFAYITGWRLPSEALTLDWNQVDLRNGLVRIDPGMTKGGEGRQFPITAALRKVLDRRKRAKQDTCALVFHVDGQAIHRRRFHAAWTDACTAAKVDGRIPHDMRRSAVRNLERASIPRKSPCRCWDTERRVSIDGTTSWPRPIFTTQAHDSTRPPLRR